MSKNILMICHSAGDAANVIEVAREINKLRGGHTLSVLTTGSVAQEKIKELFENPFEHAFFNDECDDAELVISTIEHKIGDIDAVLAGTPSEKIDDKPRLVYRLLEQWHSTGARVAMTSDYLFRDDSHHMYEWFGRKGGILSALFLPAIGAFERLPSAVGKIVQNVGHSALYNAFTEPREDSPRGSSAQSAQKVKVREKYGVEQDNKLLFVSLGDNDEELIKAVCRVIKTKPHIKVAFGVHPAIMAEPSKLAALEALIFSSEGASQLKICDRGESTEVARYAHFVLSSTSTMTAEAAVRGTPSGYYISKDADGSKFYLQGESNIHVVEGEDGLEDFLAARPQLNTWKFRNKPARLVANEMVDLATQAPEDVFHSCSPTVRQKATI